MTLTPPSDARGPRRRPGRPPAVDAEAIAAAVLEIGFARLTFAAVAERLGLAQATLYRHAPDRDQLVRLGLDRALRQHDWPDLQGEWRPLLERWAIAAWRAWEKHPGAVLESARGVMPPSIVDLSGAVGGALVARGFAPEDAVLAVDLVFDLTADSRRGVEVLDAPKDGPEGSHRGAVETQWMDRPPAAAEAAVHAEMVRAIRTEPFEWFSRKLRVALAGIQQELAPQTVSDTQPDERS